MLAYTYVERGRFELLDKPKPELKDERDAIVRITLGSICTSDLHIKHGSVLRAVCLLYTSPSPRDSTSSRMPSSA